MNVFEREIKPIYLHDGASDEKPYVIFLLRNRARMSSKMQQSQFSRIIDQCLKDPRILSIAFQATTPPGLLSFQDHASRILIALEQVTEARIVNDGHLDSVFIYGVAHDDERAEILDNYSTFTNRDLDGDNAPPQSMHPRMLAGGISRDLVDPSEYIDATQDMLGILPYASMLANVISAEDTPLPLSIGLFGEWGSGKSFFMGMLREQIRTLEETPGNCAKIAQISFNAWHYTDSNLWASLGDEIFRQLAEPHRSRGESDAEHEGRKREGRMLKEQIAAELELRDQLTAVTQQAETEAAALRRKIRETEGARMSAGSRILAALRSSETIKGGFQKVWPALGVTEAAEQGRLLADELRGTLSEADELRRMSRYRQGRVALGVAGIVLVVALCVILLAPTVQTWLTSVLTAAVVAPLATGTVMISRARAGLRKLRALAQEIHQGLADAPFAKELQELEKVEADQRVAEAQLQQVIERVGQLGRQLAELTPGRRLYAFLAERSKTEDYRGSLGLISTIRKDFERLVALLREPSHSENDPPKPVDRIVLYIDDLDRCAPAQVVEVLQAVHLLLAFDLFVVVVGVDPRWLLRSISSHYDQLIEDQPTAHRDGWRISPEDYLEKILNIPLVLPPMASGGLRQLLDSMVEPSARHADSDSTSTPPATDAAADTEPPATSRAATTAIQVEEGSQVATQLDPTQTPERPHPLFDHEVDLLARLDQLIETPRDAKRLVNLYRLVRSTRDLTETADFIDHEYQAVIVLLGAFTAHAALSGRLANALLHAPPETSWTDFLATLKPQRQSQHWTSPAIGEIADAELAAWTHLHDSLLALSNAINLPDLRVLQSWVPRVRPFSYVLPTRGR
ncbi:P-loop NTPase fold protein [Amycolatopsis tolypomycina]|uniref:P-loop NTPase fold protein n=1 Tax=Amycolatopsis tolypomycina TaxID=208445 RepID=UPI0033AA2199